MKNKLPDQRTELEGPRQNRPNEAGSGEHHRYSRRWILGVFGFAFLISLALFYFHIVVIFDVIGTMLRNKALLVEHVGLQRSGRLILLGCFFALMLAHVIEAAVWGLYLYVTRLMPSFADGTYFTAVSITTLGFGDVLLKHPWRHMGALIAVTGVLMFGCSTAFLFVVVQDVWEHFSVGGKL